ncbi:MAG TPA: DUF4105 domain-containing protein [Longimicrobiales bacterium]|nr:DUF4105 domain-containing protein [Longimicrobiales bacterium]
MGPGALLLLLGALAALPGPAQASGAAAWSVQEAQAADSGQAGEATADPLTVYLVTAAPGEAVWERFGHNGIWIHDARTGEDVFWEWGLFSFSQTGFIPRLLRGTMLYAMGGRYLSSMLQVYQAQGRDVWAQELALTPEQEAELDRFVRANALPENRDYVYNYYLDNCSTRVRDALDAVLGGSIRARFEGVETGRSWRWHTRRLLRPDPLAELGIQILLGSPADAPIDAWQEMFLPMELRAHLATATVPDGSGGERPLVVRETLILDGERGPPPTEPANRFPLMVITGILVALWTAFLARAAARSTAWKRVLGAWLVTWEGLVGLAGLVMVLGWLFTDHVFWYWNQNILQTNPVLLAVPAMAIPLLRGREPGPRLRKLLWWVRAIALAALVFKLLPGFEQDNWGIIALVLPTHLMLARAFPLSAGDGS